LCGFWSKLLWNHVTADREGGGKGPAVERRGGGAVKKEGRRRERFTGGEVDT